ncbi:hypothetical protein H257_18834 [Aphanomyces astaci]|uniref:DDE-1 domain-containing protein n=1 Tax=Aphanomyces astaci TaxID=112090 RepID=W4FC13_APHAT|nr:hypothetical protein H257_18834 [Aphanomyces astaci]ETV64253.1 hypothetical protein H257_18834 [Aphanomyces astaci]|eukprot:XP_009846263.1 hypothetical protein H257_18834 [Aphanomyces astaci]
MGPFKKLLRTLWLDEAPVTSAADKRRAMILRSIKAWEMISSDAIQKSFQKAILRPRIVVVVARFWGRPVLLHVLQAYDSYA